MDYDRAKEALKNVLVAPHADKESARHAFRNVFSSLTGVDADRRAVSESAFKAALYILVAKRTPVSGLIALVDLAIACVLDEGGPMAPAALPYTLLQDLCDCVTLDRLEEVFDAVQARHLVLTEGALTAVSTKAVSRMSMLLLGNDILRRLSKSQNTVFCGRVLIFLAQIFPLNEKSALNITSTFNKANVTSFQESDDAGDAPTTGAGDDGEAGAASREANDALAKAAGAAVDRTLPAARPIDHVFYKRFWSLQRFFSNPLSVYPQDAWADFRTSADAVLAVFRADKVEGGYGGREMTERTFPKFLTAKGLMGLQLSDAHFRRVVLLQFLILFQYLLGNVKSRPKQLVLKPDMEEWVKKTGDAVYEALEETPPDGPRFAKAVRGLLERENNWSEWKNAGCESFERSGPDAPKTAEATESAAADATAAAQQKQQPRKRKREMFAGPAPSAMLDTLKAPTRKLVPDLREFLDEALEQLDPEAQVEKEYRLTTDPIFSFRATRLLLRNRVSCFVALQDNELSLEAAITKYGEEIDHPAVKAALVEKNGAAASKPGAAGGSAGTGGDEAADKSTGEAQAMDAAEGEGTGADVSEARAEPAADAPVPMEAEEEGAI